MRITIFCISIALGITFYGHAQVSIDSCRNKARENFPLIQQYDLIEKSKEYTISNANKSYLPQLDITVIGGVIHGFPSFSQQNSSESSKTQGNMISIVQLNQTIWDGGITKARKEIAQASAKMENADVEVTMYSLNERVDNLFFGILLIEEQVKQLEILRSTMNRNLKRVEIAIENGTAFRSDVDEIMVEVINTDQKIEELKSNRSAYINVLAAMIGEEIENNAVFSRPVKEEDIITLQNNRPELRLFAQQEKLFEAQRKIDKSMMYPKVGLLGFGTFIQPGIDFGPSKITEIFVGGLSLNWNIGALYKNENNKKLTEINLQKVDVQRETFLFNNNLELTQTQVELEKFSKLIAQDREILALKTKIKNAYDIKYENGISTLSQMLDKTNEESVAQQNLIVHEIKYLMKVYQYKNKSGN